MFRANDRHRQKSLMSGSVWLPDRLRHRLQNSWVGGLLPGDVVLHQRRNLYRAVQRRVIRSVVDGTMFFTVNISRYDCGGQNV